MAYDWEKEKREAADAGNRALRSLKEAQDNLNSAKDYETKRLPAITRQSLCYLK